MSDIKIQPSATGSATVTLTAPTTGTARTVTLPDSTDTLAVNSDVTNKLPLAGGTMTGTIAGFTSTGIDDNATSTAITIDASENVGIGVVPESTNIHSSYSSIDISRGGALAGHSAGNGMKILGNSYRTASGYAYKNTDKASLYANDDGLHEFKVAPSGSADAAITWDTAMTIDNSGRVIQHKKIYSIYKSYGGGVGDLTGGTLVDSEGITFSTSTGKWTAPIAGLYQMGGSFYTNGDTTMEVYIKKNGSSTAFLNNLTSNRNSFGYSVSTIIYLAANDTVNFANLKGSIRSAASDYRWIFRIG